MPTFKIPLRRVASDDCAIMLGRVITDGQVVNPGVGHYIHKGEWVELVPVTSIADLVSLMELAEVQSEPDNALLLSLQSRLGNLTAEEQTTVKRLVAAEVQRTQAMMGRITERCERLAHQVVSWNWTDLQSNPLPQPWGNVDALMGLSNDEVVWLINQVQTVESPAETKNA